MSDAALAAEGISFAYQSRDPVLRLVSASIPRGGLVGILGPNGSGKTTLLRLLGGLLRPSAGRISLDGTGMAASRHAQARITPPWHKYRYPDWE